MDDEFVTVHNANWLHEALFVKSVLEADGISAFVPDEHTVSVDPALVAALGGVRVQVPKADADRARQILATALPADAENPADFAQ